MSRPIRVMVVDDSIVFRSWLLRVISDDPRFEAVGCADSAMDAERKIPALKPDVLTLDIEMPGMNGIEFLQRLLPVHPLPVILVSSLNLRVFDALAAGAVDFVRKPDAETGVTREAFAMSLKAKLVMAASARVHLPASSVSCQTILERAAKRQARPAAGALSSPASSAGRQEPLIAIGASTGGTEAILEVVRCLPPQTPGIVVTQHMPAGFTKMYAERLSRLCRMEVREAQNGDHVRRGLILIAPGGLQMRVVALGGSYTVSIAPGEKVNGHAPSVDVLFDSVAKHAGSNAIGVLLTGMGADGAAGLLRMRKNGAYTIGQDKATCVVYGMPMEAWKIGAVCKQLPLNGIAQAILEQAGVAYRAPHASPGSTRS